MDGGWQDCFGYPAQDVKAIRVARSVKSPSCVPTPRVSTAENRREICAVLGRLGGEWNVIFTAAADDQTGVGEIAAGFWEGERRVGVGWLVEGCGSSRPSGTLLGKIGSLPLAARWHRPSLTMSSWLTSTVACLSPCTTSQRRMMR